MTAFWWFSEDFPPLSEDFRRFSKLFRRPDECSRTFSENFRKFPKMSEDCRRLLRKTRRCLDDTPTNLKCIWQIFFICSIKSPQCADKCSKKKFFDSDFPSPCFDVPKASNFISGGVQNRDTKNRRLGTIVTSIQDSKPREKQISQSFSYC